MEQKILSLNNQELLQLYRLLIEHKEYLETENKTLTEEQE